MPNGGRVPDKERARQEMTGGTILLVDDNAELLHGLTTLLENGGYRVVTLPNGATISETVALEKPDLVVLDVMMPLVDGWEALRRIRENPANEHIPVMMLTAKSTEDAKVHGFSLGTDDYLAKPFGVREFRWRVEALLRRSRQERREADRRRLPVIVQDGAELLDSEDIYYVEGVRNYTYIHTYDARFLGRIHLGGIEELGLPGFMRVHRSYIVRLEGVRGFRRAGSSSYRVVLDDAEGTEIPVSRRLASDVRERLGL
jgi:DNA-binding LytR/AlgR family response regulator